MFTLGQLEKLSELGFSPKKQGEPTLDEVITWLIGDDPQVELTLQIAQDRVIATIDRWPNPPTGEFEWIAGAGDFNDPKGACPDLASALVALAEKKKEKRDGTL